MRRLSETSGWSRAGSSWGKLQGAGIEVRG